ncbi:major histocompatibility complex class I-related gene protein-like [Hippocampus zosterae]|uniref:major histocompatibility complex class I-related gene protein-like n=1 Tax=Hippocampus zosterae TaxID=109293 RepID=UPI00223CFA42|nr:major histocompatibility complex class I-related gene protein-like [Hippocampus zosterae]
MNKVAWFVLVWSHVASAALHSLWHVYTVTSNIPRLPSMMAVVVVDGVMTEYYDSRTKVAVAKQKWMDAILHEEPYYWTKQTAFWERQEHYGSINLRILKDRFNQSDGVHVFQVLHGCEYDDESRMVWGFNHHSYDADTTLVLDMKRQQWLWLKPQLEPTGRKWNNNEGWLDFMEGRLLGECPYRLNKTLEAGKSVLQRIQRPLVSLLQTRPSAPVTCHATGFYPDKADIFWARDSEQLHEHVAHGQILPNHDGTFQVSVSLDVDAVPPSDWRRYDCVFSLSGLPGQIITTLDAASIKTNYVKPVDHTGAIVATIAFIAVTVLSVGVGIFVYRKRRREHHNGTLQQAASPSCVYTDTGENVSPAANEDVQSRETS